MVATVVEEEVVSGLSVNIDGQFYEFVIGVVGQRIFHTQASLNIYFPGMTIYMKLVRISSTCIVHLISSAQVVAALASVIS